MASHALNSCCEDDSLDARTLRHLQRHSFDYFVHESNPANGLVLDKTAADWPASIAAVGMALTVYPVGVARGFMTRADAVARTLTTLRFFADSEQGEAHDATGHRGFYYHFVDFETGRRAWDCELSSIDTALLMAGVLAAVAFFDGDDPREAEIRRIGTFLYERVDWHWMLNGGTTICHGWRPKTGFLRYRWEGYDEALILYLLALGSPTHRHRSAMLVVRRVVQPPTQWKRRWKASNTCYAGPLFIHQMSHLWVRFPRPARRVHARSTTATTSINSRIARPTCSSCYAMRNPRRHAHVDARVRVGHHRQRRARRPDEDWSTAGGVAASSTTWRVAYRRGPTTAPLAPWAVVASLPFAPEIVAPTITRLAKLHVDVPNPYGFKASFNPTFDGSANAGVGWVSPYHFGINEGPTVLMIENHRTGMIWDLMRRCVPLRRGLERAGFDGGWLEAGDEPPLGGD